MLSPLRCTIHAKRLNHAALALTNTNLGQVVSSLTGCRNYSQDKGGKSSSCNDIEHTAGMKVEPWSKPDQSLQGWRVECPIDEPQPPNYDPYKIKVPDIAVPPLPPSNVKAIPNKDSTELFKKPGFSMQTSCCIHDLFHNSPIVHPDYWKDKPKRLAEVAKVMMPNLGYHGKSKYKYAFHEPWKPLDRLSLLEEAEKTELELTEKLSMKAET